LTAGNTDVWERAAAAAAAAAPFLDGVGAFLCSSNVASKSSSAAAAAAGDLGTLPLATFFGVDLETDEMKTRQGCQGRTKTTHDLNFTPVHDKCHASRRIFFLAQEL
jgi:hypothetical protein